MSEAPPLLEVRKLCKAYRSGSEQIQILQDVCLVVPHSRSLALLGQSGSGKSTFLNILGGLDRGRCREHRLFGQRPHPAFGSGTHRVSAKFCRFYLPAPLHAQRLECTRKRHAAVPHCREIAQIQCPSRSRITRCSWPERTPGAFALYAFRRRASARGNSTRLANEPRFVLADEPTGSLDHENAQIVAELLFSLCREFGTSMILATHDPTLSAMADWQYRLENMGIHRVHENR